MIHLVVTGPSELARSCMVAGLAGARGIWAEACANPADHAGPTPDLLLLQDIDDVLDAPQLADYLDSASRYWATTKVIVLTNGARASLRTCQAAGVRACLPFRADVDQIITAIHLIQTDLIVYPADVLAEPVAAPRGAKQAGSPHLRCVSGSDQPD